jgi:hypothetical protein
MARTGPVERALRFIKHNATAATSPVQITIAPPLRQWDQTSSPGVTALSAGPSSPPWTHPAELGPALNGGAFFDERAAHEGRTSTFREPQAEHFSSRAKTGNDVSP